MYYYYFLEKALPWEVVSLFFSKRVLARFRLIDLIRRNVVGRKREYELVRFLLGISI